MWEKTMLLRVREIREMFCMHATCTQHTSHVACMLSQYTSHVACMISQHTSHVAHMLSQHTVLACTEHEVATPYVGMAKALFL